MLASKVVEHSPTDGHLVLAHCEREKEKKNDYDTVPLDLGAKYVVKVDYDAV